MTCERHERRQLLERFVFLQALTVFANSYKTRVARGITTYGAPYITLATLTFGRVLDTTGMTDEIAVVTETEIEEVIAIVAVQDPPITAHDVSLAR